MIGVFPYGLAMQAAQIVADQLAGSKVVRQQAPSLAAGQCGEHGDDQFMLRRRTKASAGLGVRNQLRGHGSSSVREASRIATASRNLCHGIFLARVTLYGSRCKSRQNPHSQIRSRDATSYTRVGRSLLDEGIFCLVLLCSHASRPLEEGLE